MHENPLIIFLYKYLLINHLHTITFKHSHFHVEGIDGENFEVFCGGVEYAVTADGGHE